MELSKISYSTSFELYETNFFSSIADLPLEMRDLLSQFQNIFRMLVSLPTSSNIDHRIVLKEGTQPIYRRPYRYPHIQKNEIELLVKEMLMASIICPSNRPFSSPVLLVKKDGSWQFCIDYRVLDSVKVPDKFLIPVIEELLDELHGSRVFSKIDLKSRYHPTRMH